jgi:hypothetical protein
VLVVDFQLSKSKRQQAAYRVEMPMGSYEQRPGVTTRQRQQKVILQATQPYFFMVWENPRQKPAGVIPTLLPRGRFNNLTWTFVSKKAIIHFGSFEFTLGISKDAMGLQSLLLLCQQSVNQFSLRFTVSGAHEAPEAWLEYANGDGFTSCHESSLAPVKE